MTKGEAYSFTAPATMPPKMYFWKKIYSSKVGRATRMIAALKLFQVPCRVLLKFMRVVVKVLSLEDGIYR